MITLKYGNTNTFFFPGPGGGLLLDTGYAGEERAFHRALKANGIGIKDIRYVLATHYHPDHMGLIGGLAGQGVKLLLVDLQQSRVHFADPIFARDGLQYTPIDESAATVITCGESRGFLAGIGLAGEIVPTPSHSGDSVSLVLDNGDCFVGDLEPYEYLAGYADNPALQSDWERILAFRPGRIFYAHAPARVPAPPAAF